MGSRRSPDEKAERDLRIVRHRQRAADAEEGTELAAARDLLGARRTAALVSVKDARVSLDAIVLHEWKTGPQRERVVAAVQEARAASDRAVVEIRAVIAAERRERA